MKGISILLTLHIMFTVAVFGAYDVNKRGLELLARMESGLID